MNTNYVTPEIKVIEIECENTIAQTGFPVGPEEEIENSGDIQGKSAILDDSDWD